MYKFKNVSFPEIMKTIFQVRGNNYYNHYNNMLILYLTKANLSLIWDQRFGVTTFWNKISIMSLNV